MPTTNAAFLLAYRLRNWVIPAGQHPEDVRGFDSIDHVDAWRAHADTCDLIRAVDNTLIGMDAIEENVDMFVTALPRWYAAVHFAATPWGSTKPSTRQTLREGDLNLLEALGALIKATKPVTLGEDDRRSLSDVIDEAMELLRTDSDDIPDNVRAYLWSLISRAQQILGALDEFSTETARQIALELGGAMVVQAERAAATGNTERANRWRSTAMHLMVGFMGGASSGAAEIAAAAALKQLGGG